MIFDLLFCIKLAHLSFFIFFFCLQKWHTYCQLINVIFFMELISGFKAVKQNTQDDVTYEMLIRCTSYNTFALFRRFMVIFLLFFLFHENMSWGGGEGKAGSK